MRRLLWAILIVGLTASAAGALERFPPPEFDTGYRLPPTQTPQPRSLAWEYLDVGLLAAGLVLATVAALKWRSRKVLFGLMLGALFYFGFVRKGCVCPIGAIQNVAEGIANPAVVVPWAIILFFALPLVATLAFGRTFCASICPLGAVQDAALVRPVRVPAWLEHALGVVPFLYLGGAVLFAMTGMGYIICRYDPFIGLFRVVDFPNFQVGGAVTLLSLTGLFLVLGMFIGRPYCRFLCPYGAILRPLSRVSWKHVTITPEECIDCSLCADACPYGAIREPTEAHGDRLAGKGRLVALLVALPVLVAAGGGLGYLVSEPLAALHPRVQLSELVYHDEAGRIAKPTVDEQDLLDAFRGTGQTPKELYAEARGIVSGFAGHWATYLVRPLWAERRGYLWSIFVPGPAVWFGGFVGLVVGLKLVGLSVRRRRTGWEPDRSMCVSCGRCFHSCPVGRKAEKEAS